MQFRLNYFVLFVAAGLVFKSCYACYSQTLQIEEDTTTTTGFSFQFCFEAAFWRQTQIEKVVFEPQKRLTLITLEIKNGYAKNIFFDGGTPERLRYVLDRIITEMNTNKSWNYWMKEKAVPENRQFAIPVLFYLNMDKWEGQDDYRNFSLSYYDCLKLLQERFGSRSPSDYLLEPIIVDSRNKHEFTN